MKLKEIIIERVRDPEDWDEGNTEPPNNFAVYINGKKWKVFKGRGQFADDYKERDHYRQLQSWAQQKSASTGKKWEVFVTGEPTTEATKPHPKELEMDAKVRSAGIQLRANDAEKRLAARKAEPKTLGQKIAKDIGGPLKKLAKGDVRGAFGEDATAGGTSAANVSVGAVYKNKSAKQAKNKDGTAKNALDMKGVGLLTGGSLVKR
jgi:hypothetical protein